MRAAMAILALAACACTPSPAPVTPTLDADASFAVDVSAPPSIPTTIACSSACLHLTAIGCMQATTCATTLSAVVAYREVRNSKTGAALVCEDLLVTSSASDVVANGWGCGP